MKATVAGGAAVQKTEVTGATSDAASRKYTTQFRQSKLEDFEELHAIGGKPQASVVAGARSPGSAGSRGLESGEAPTSAHAEETKEDPDPMKLIQKNTSKRSRDETKFEAYPTAKKVSGSTPAIGKKGSLTSVYSEVSHGYKETGCATENKCHSPKTDVGEKGVETSKDGKQPIDITLEAEKTPKVVKAAGDEQSIFKRMDTKARVENPIAQLTTSIQIENIASTSGDSIGDIHEDGHVKARTAGGEGVGGSGASARKIAHERLNQGVRLRSVLMIHWATYTTRLTMIVAPMKSTPLCGI
ncbi:hypothetical protein Hanom_Chr09g00794621 [Helianthus anomalus]